MIFLGLSVAYNPDELLAGFLKGKEKKFIEYQLKIF